ncbi:MAG: FeoB small GTPase domain-containing protein [Bacillota bacterium]
MDCGRSQSAKKPLWKRILGNITGGVCHSVTGIDTSGLSRIVLVGSPNVGKSALFNRLTGAYVTVSNYPGTTVEVFKGKGRINGREWAIIDTPGTYSLLPLTEEQRITRAVLLEEDTEVILHVVDAKNLERMLIFTMELVEAGLPVILVLNIIDEAESLGLQFDTAKLEQALGIPVVATAAALGRGVDALKEKIAGYTARAHACCERRAI